MSESGPPCDVANARHQCAWFAKADPSAPKILVGWHRERVQIRHHCGAMFRLMTHAANGIIQVFAVFALNILYMTARTIALENCLPINLGGLNAFGAFFIGHGRRWRWRQNVYAQVKNLAALVGGDGDGFEQYAALARKVDRRNDLPVGAGRNEPTVWKAVPPWCNCTNPWRRESSPAAA